MENELTHGPVMKTMLKFAIPMILGDLLQQCYNIADTLIVGRFLGADALAAVGSAFSLMTFLTSILLGLAMGSGTVFSIRFGQKDETALKEGVLASFVLLGVVTVILNILVFAGVDWIIWFLRTPDELTVLMKDYLIVIFAGLAGIFLYNFFASLLRSLGNSVVPLAFLAISAGLNIILDLLFVAVLNRGVAGAAEATVIAQYVSGIGIAVYTKIRFPHLLCLDGRIRLRRSRIKEITNFSALTCLQQSIMNLGILAVQGLVNSFGTTIMASFAAAVKIDAFAYLPVQDFGNAFFNLHCAELRRRTDRAYQKRNPGGSCDIRRFQSGHFTACLYIRRPSDVTVYRLRRNRCYIRGRPLSAHRRCFLRTDRYPLPALRTVPCIAENRGCL